MTTLQTHNNVVADPWLAALYANGKNKYVSLRQLITDWDQIADITGVDGLSTLCIYHFLKILLMKVSGGVTSVDDVERLLASNQLQQDVLQYLDDNIHLFNIRDPERPFLQIAEIGQLKTSNGSLLCQPDNLNSLIITGKTEKDLLFGYQYFIDETPEFDFIDTVQFLLREGFAGNYGRCSSLSSLNEVEMRKLGQETFEANAGKSVLVNRLHVYAKLETIKQTLIVNLPLCSVDENEQAPWEKERRPFPKTITPQNEFQLASMLTKSTLILWDGDSPHKVFSGPCETVDRDWLDTSLPLDKTFLQSCPRITKQHTLKLMTPSDHTSDWSDIKIVFETLGRSSITPAEITRHWSDLKDEGIIPNTFGYEVIGVVMAGISNPAIARITQASLVMPSNLLNGGLISRHLLSLMGFISDIDRELFLPGFDESDDVKDTKDKKKRKLVNMRPINLLNYFARWVKPGSTMGTTLKTRYPLSEQYLSLMQPVVEEAIQWIIDNPQGNITPHITEWKQQALSTALELWNSTLTTLPLTTIRYVQAVGHANAKVQFIRRKMENKIHGNR